MKTVVLFSIKGAAFALAIASVACQSSSSAAPSDPTGGMAGAGGDTSAMGGSPATGTGGMTAMGTGGAGTAGTGVAGTGAGAMAGTTGASGMGGGSAMGTGGMGASGASGSTGTGGMGAGGMCGKVGTLHPPDPAKPGIYCPFGGPMGMGGSECLIGKEHCCEGNVGEVTMCVAIGTVCPQMKATDWACEDPSDCGAAGMQCCGNGTVVVNANPMCGNYASKMTGTICKATCDSTDTTMCTSDAQCAAGKTCIPFSKAGNQVGGCSK